MGDVSSRDCYTSQSVRMFMMGLTVREFFAILWHDSASFRALVCITAASLAGAVVLLIVTQ